MGNKNGKSKDNAQGENESEADKQTELEGTDVDELYKADKIVHELKANTDLDDVQSDPHVPVKQNESNSEHTKDTENKECANATNSEAEQNADFAGIEITDSASEGLKIKETEKCLVSTHVTENNQSPLKSEALSEQKSNTENAINLIDNTDTESNLSKLTVDTDTIVTDLKVNTDFDDVQSDPNMPVEQNESNSEHTKDTDNKECSNATNAEAVQNACIAGIEITDSASKGLKIEETETYLLSTHETENNQLSLKSEALSEQKSNTENAINLIANTDIESNLSKLTVDTDTSVTDLKVNTDLDDVPVEKIDSKSENKKEIENNINNEFANDENEQNANFTGIEIKDSTSEGLKIEETVMPLVSTHVAENNQSSLQMEAINKQPTVTENEINVIDKMDTESNSKPNGDTETGVNDISATIETNDIKGDSFENDARDSVENVPKEGEKSIPIVSEQYPLSNEISLRNTEDIEREVDVKISEFKFVDETLVQDTKLDDEFCDDSMIDNITESQRENEDKTAINIFETEPANTIISMKYNHNNKKNNVDNTSKIDSTGEQETSEEEQNIAIASGQEVVKTQFEQEYWKDKQKEISCEQHVNETISQDCVSKESEKCMETYIENGRDNSNKNLEKVTSEFCWEDGGTNVQITGSFNNWESKMDMNKRNDVFVISIDLLPGEYTYKYYVDGEWKVDENKLIKIDDAGQKNNVVVVAERMQ